MVRFRPSFLAVLFALFIVSGAVLSPAASAAEQSTAPQAFIEQSRVNINTASAEEIAAVLKGIGPARANAIVDYRRANGAFTDIEQLLDVKGIAERTLEVNRDRILLH